MKKVHVLEKRIVLKSKAKERSWSSSEDKKLMEIFREQLELKEMQGVQLSPLSSLPTIQLEFNVAAP